MILIRDNLPARRGKSMRDLARRQHQLHPEYVPAYAPELNPCELLFAHQKRPLLNHALPGLDCLHDHADDHLRRLVYQQNLLRSFIEGTPLKLRWPT